VRERQPLERVRFRYLPQPRDFIQAVTIKPEMKG
jgi:hypothetical protein